MRERIRILGIDPGSQLTGYGIVELAGGRTAAVAWGSIATSGDHPARLRAIFIELGRIVTQHRPHEIAIEQVFVHRNADSALKLGQARAAAICATFAADVPLFEYTPRHIKKAVAGRGGAEKSQVQHMVRMLLGVREAIAADAADALAAALCHAHERSTQALLARAVALS